MVRNGRIDADDRLVRHAARRFAIQTAVAVAVVVVLAALVTYLAVSRGNASDAEHRAESAAVTADDVTDPPPGVTLVEQRGKESPLLSPNAPVSVARVRPAALALGRTEVTVGGYRYLAYTAKRDGGVRTTALVDLSAREGEEERLLGALVLGGAFAVVAAGLVGWLIGVRAVRPLAEALDLQRRFVADASHELRTPLTALHTRVQLVRRRLRTDDETVDAHIDQLVSDTRAMDEVLSDLLQSAELRHRPEHRELVDLRALAGEVVMTMRPRADELGVSLAAHGVAECRVLGSRSALRRAVTALVDNALAHTSAGGTVSLDVRRDHDHVTLAVSDDGTGVDPRRVDELTRRFARGNDDAGHGRRFGLGLALVHEVVRAHDGDLRVTAGQVGGSVFSLVLPPARSRSAHPAAALRELIARVMPSSRQRGARAQSPAGERTTTRSWR